MTGFGRQQLRKAEYYAVGVAVLFIVAIGASGIAVGAEDVLARLAGLSPQLIGLLLLMSMINYLLRTLRWQLFGRELGMEVPLGRTLLIYFAGFAMTPTPGKMGEALRLWLLQRIYGFRYARSGAVLIGDRVGDLAAITALILFGVGAFAGYGLSIALILAGGSAVILMLAKSGPLLRLIGALFRLIGRWPRLFAALRQAVRRTAELFTPRLALAALGLGVVGWFAECLGLYWLVNEMGAAISLQAASFIFCFSLMVGAVSMLPGGLGSTEVTMIALLTLVEVPADVALAATAVNRAVTLWFAVLLGTAILPAALRLARGPALAEEAAGGRG